ncbi:MAG: transposase [Planctomycetaceae bacterium]
MHDQSQHRKKVRHFEDDLCVHELTFSCYRRRSLLTRDRWLTMFSESVSNATARHYFDLIAFVWMPEHVHLLVLPRSQQSSISALLKAIKRPFSFHIKRMIESSDPHLLQQLTVRQRPGVMTFRFWQEGPGYDRNLCTAASISAAMDYIHLNPVRRGLCRESVDWKWSSARFILRDEVDEDLPRLHKVDWQLLE